MVKIDLLPKYYLYRLCVILFTFLLGGCTTTSIFTPYPEKIKPLLQRLDQQGSLDIPIPEKTNGQNEILHYLEQGRLAQINQQYDISKHYFELAIAYFDKVDLEAQISATTTGQQGSALLVNDNIIRYAPPAYENLYVHQLQALNYLFASNLESAGVEVRRANMVHEKALRAHEKELEKSRTKAARLPINLENTNSKINRLYSSADKAANTLKSSFQNGYSFYTSALIYELRNEWEDAFIDYQKALEINPNNIMIQYDVQRLAKRLGHKKIADTLTKKTKLQQSTHLNQHSSIKQSKDNSEIIILYENGFVPEKKETSIPLTNYRNKAIAISFPHYDRAYFSDTSLTSYINFNEFATSTPLSNTYALATKSLQEQRLAITVRQIGRAIAKAKLVESSEHTAGGLGAIIASVYNMISERADLRSWLSLPNNVQLIRMPISAGEATISLKPDASSLNSILPLTIKPNTITIIQLTNTGNRLFTRSVSFNRS